MTTVRARAGPGFPLKRAIRRLLRMLYICGETVWEGYVRFARQRHLLFAASVSYYGIISLAPLLAVTLTVCGWLIHSEEAGRALAKALAEVFPVDMETFQNAARVVSATSPWAFVIYLLCLAWAGAYLFESVERVINAVCGQSMDRAYHVRKLIGMLTALAAGMLLLISVVLGAAWAALTQAVPLPPDEFLRLRHLIHQGAVLIPLVTSTVTFTLIYKFMPIKRVPWRAALSGGVFAGLAWELSKWAFGLFVVLSGRNYGALYGSLANIVIIMLWIHLSAVILILGAHIGCVVQERIENWTLGE